MVTTCTTCKTVKRLVLDDSKKKNDKNEHANAQNDSQGSREWNNMLDSICKCGVQGIFQSLESYQPSCDSDHKVAGIWVIEFGNIWSQWKYFVEFHS